MTGKISGSAKGTMQESELKHSVDFILQVYYLVIGFEVNGGQETFFCRKTTVSRGREKLEDEECIHDIDKGDYGHAFFYTADSAGKVISFFSFGPTGFFPDKVSDPQNPSRKDYAKSRPSTASYRITELTKMFRFIISKELAEKIAVEVDRFATSNHSYAVWKNSTCASEARSVLEKAGVNTPHGSSKIKSPLGLMGKSSSFNTYNFVNPYMWYKQLEEKYGKPIIFIAPYLNVRYRYLNTGMYYKYADKYILDDQYHWTRKRGDDDPLFCFPFASSGIRIHGKF